MKAAKQFYQEKKNYSDEAMEGIDPQIIHILDEYANQSKWISVEERKPESFLNQRSESVLAVTKLPTGIEGEFEFHILRGYVYYLNWKWFWSEDNTSVENEVTHWQPLPENPNPITPKKQ